MAERENGEIVANDGEHLRRLIEETILEKGPNCDLNFIDVSNVKDMRGMFCGSEFNGDISKWDVSGVENMNGMFSQSKFNGDISGWNVSNVKSMAWIFSDSRFNGDVSKWDVSGVENMNGAFRRSDFDGDISQWDVSNVRSMRWMFYESRFNGDVSRWNVSNVEDMRGMFYESRFGGDVSGWDVSNVKDTFCMFKDPFVQKLLDNIRQTVPIARVEELSHFQQIREARETKANPNATKKELEEAEARRKRAYEAIVSANMRFVLKVSLQYRCCPIPLPDLVSEGVKGLERAIDSFDATSGLKFISYAVWWIKAYITRAINENGCLVRSPRPREEPDAGQN